MTKAQVSGSLLLRTHSVTAYATTALVRLILRRATQYIVTTCVCEKRPGNCFLPPWPVPVASVHVGVGREPSPQTSPCRRTTQRALRNDRPSERRCIEPSTRASWMDKRRILLVFEAVGDLSGTTRRCGKSERRDGRPRAAIVEQQDQPHKANGTCAKMILWQSGPSVRKDGIPCS